MRYQQLPSTITSLLTGAAVGAGMMWYVLSSPSTFPTARDLAHHLSSHRVEHQAELTNRVVLDHYITDMTSANVAVQLGLERLHEQGYQITPQTNNAIFSAVRERAETEPEILDHLGPNATNYLEQQTVDKYTSIVERGFKNAADKLVDKAAPYVDALTDKFQERRPE